LTLYQQLIVQKLAVQNIMYDCNMSIQNQSKLGKYNSRKSKIYTS